MKLADGNKPIKVGDPSFIYKGVYNPIHWVGDKPYRPRVETLVIKNARYVYANIDDDIESYPSDLRYKHYSIPGGSLDSDSSSIEQAEAETNEEALVKVTSMYHTGITYYQLYEPGFIAKGGDTPLEYYGSISDVYIGVYDGTYDKSLVEEKDLDPKMAEHGKFHNIKDIAHLLRKEHVEALIASRFIAPDVKLALRLNRNDIVSESTSAIIVPNRYLYHASTYKIEEFRPMSLDLGNLYDDPGWSTFCFDNYNTARVYGLMRAIMTWVDSMDIGINLVFSKGHILLTEKDYNRYLELADITSKFSYYIYTIDSEPLDVGLGNDKTLKEYTFKESGVKPVSTDSIKLSLYDIKELVDVVAEVEAKEDNEYSALLIHEYNDEDKVRNALTKAVKDGKLNPGDDVLQYMSDNGLSFDNDEIKLSDITIDIDEPVLEGIDLSMYYLMEETYPIDCYGLPERKAYPMPDEKHVKSAIRFFNYAKPEEETELAEKINQKIREYKMTDVSVGDENRFKKYYEPITESYNLTEYLKVLETVHESIMNESDNRRKYALYEQSKSVIKMMAVNLEAGLVTGITNDKDLSSIIDHCYNALAEINQNQMEILSKTTESILESVRESKFKALLEEVLQPVTEAEGDEDDEDSATDYTAMADDEGAEDDDTTEDTDDDTATDYSAMADEEDTDDDTDDTPPEDDPTATGEDTPTGDTTDTEDETNADEGEETDDTDTGEDTGGDGATDYTAMADESGADGEDDGTNTTEDNMGGTEDSTNTEDSGIDNTGETDENTNRYDNKELKNYFLLQNFLSMHETVVDVLDSVNSIILPTPEANSIMVKVVKNLQTIKSFIEKFIQFHFNDSDYAFNLYYYNILTNALKINLKLLEEAINISETKNKK